MCRRRPNAFAFTTGYISQNSTAGFYPGGVSCTQYTYCYWITNFYAPDQTTYNWFAGACPTSSTSTTTTTTTSSPSTTTTPVATTGLAPP